MRNTEEKVDSQTFLNDLLAQQQDLSAVEAFSVNASSAIAETPAQSRYYKSLLPASPPSPGEQYAFEVDLDKCSGCKSCVVACHSLNGLEEEESWRKVGAITIGAETPELKYYTSACHHCADPGCLNGCPVLAYDKDPLTGIVKHLDDQCIGCKYCTMMCPYEVPTYSSRLGIVRKCDMCSQRLASGEAPACVQSCPNEAIAITRVATPEFADETQCVAPGSAPSNITLPTTIYKSEKQVDPNLAAEQGQWMDEPAESHWPLAAMLIGTQASVGTLVIFQLSDLIRSSSARVELLVLAAAFILAVAGLTVAPLHLGQPSRSWRIFLGLRKSWLSREGVLLGIYAGMLSSTVMLAASRFWLAPESLLNAAIPSAISRVLPWFTGLIGILGLFSSGMIYVATKRSLWQASRTLPLFAGTAVVLGFAWLGFAYSLTAGYPAYSIGCSSIGVLACVLKWNLESKLLPSDKISSELVARSQVLVSGPLSGLGSQRRITVFAAVAFTGLASILASSDYQLACSAFLACGALSLTAAEYFERLLYFKSVVYPRMPGVIQ